MNERPQFSRSHTFDQIVKVFEDYLDPLFPPARVFRIRDICNSGQGIYVGLRGTQIRYVGSVSRRKGGIRDRLESHHKQPEVWTEIWIFPFSPAVSTDSVRACEAAMIRVFKPQENVLGKAA